VFELAVGVPSWPSPSTTWDWWAPAGVVLASIVLRRAGRMPFGVPLLVGAVVGGTLFGSAVHALGVVSASAISLVIAIALMLLRRAPSGG
jgi:hypothetical protein